MPSGRKYQFPPLEVAQYDDDSFSAMQFPLERIKRIDSEGQGFWSGRDLVPVLGYGTWQRLTIIFQEIYSSLCLEDPAQTEIVPTFIDVQIGSGAIRTVPNWHVYSLALDRVLRRIASHKPEAVRELRRRTNARLRIEIEIGAALLDF